MLFELLKLYLQQSEDIKSFSLIDLMNLMNLALWIFVTVVLIIYMGIVWKIWNDNLDTSQNTVFRANLEFQREHWVMYTILYLLLIVWIVVGIV